MIKNSLRINNYLSDKKRKLFGLLLIITAIIGNPFVLDYLAQPSFDLHYSHYILVIAVDWLLFLTGFLIRASSAKEKKKIIIKILAPTISIVITIILFEISLRFFPQLYGYPVAYAVLNKYNDELDGIYYYDQTLTPPYNRIKFMKPNFKTINYDRYFWLHQTDFRGFRNNQNRFQTDLVLLGDSFIYGHGVNFDKTVGFYLEKMSGLKVANLGREDASAFEEMYFLTNSAIQYDPKYIFYFFFENDINDLKGILTRKEMEEFIKTPVGVISFPDKKKAYHYDLNQAFFYPILRKPYILKMLHLVIPDLNNKKNINKPYYQNPETFDPQSLEWHYTKRAILQMKYIADTHKISFVIVPIIPFYPQIGDILKEFAQDKEIAFIETRDKINKDHPELFLPEDNHFTDIGASTMAEILANYLSKHPK